VTRMPKRILTGLLLTTFLCSCGGSSGGGAPTSVNNTPASTPAPTTPPTTAIAYDTAEYRENTALAQMNIQAAYLNGITGNGVLVAVIDSGVTEIPELQGKLHAQSTNIVTGNAADSDDIIGHGTLMAGIIAANRDQATNNSPFNMHGVAFDAQILNINATSDANCPDADNCDFFHSDIANAYDYARINGADVINESLGSNTPSSAGLRAAVQRAVNAGIVIVVPAGNIADDDPAGTGDAAQLSADVAYEPWANGQIIIAGSVDSNNQISDFSYRAGAAAQDVFLVAPGRNITAPDYDPGGGSGYVGVTGTSASTAQISGAVALLIQAFPSLSAAQVTDLLFTTATDLGAPGTDIIYGRGLINLQEAFSAQGQLVIAGSGFGAGLDIGTEENVSTQTFVYSGGAFGADMSFAGAVDNIMVLDRYDRSYHVDFTKTVRATQPSMSIIDFMDSGATNRYQSIAIGDGASMRLGWRQDNRFSEIDRKYFSNHLGRDERASGLRMAISYALNDEQYAIVSSGMSLVEMMEDYRPDDYMAPNKHGFSSLLSATNTDAIGYKSQLSQKWSYQNAYASSSLRFGDELSTGPIDVNHNLMLNRFSHRTSDNLNIAFDIGFLNEEGSVLGSISRGALEIGTAATTAFGGAKIDYTINANTMLFARASYGMTNVSGSSRSILGDVSKLKSYSYLVGIKGQKMIFDSDQISFTVSQPLRLSSGYATVSNVTDRNYVTGQFTTSYDRISLNPTGTERDFELAYSINGFYGANLKLNILHQLNPGHIKSIKSATTMLLRLGSDF
jgi:subtilisin family serine protease